MNRKYIVIRTLVIIALLIGIYFIGSYFVSLSTIQAKSASFKKLVDSHYCNSVIVYTVLFAIFVATTFPIAIPMALVGGYLFGTFWGGLYTAIATTVGCVAAFLFFRYVLGVPLRKKFGERLAHFNKRVEEFGPSYLLLLHYAAVFPYFIINSLAALTNMSFWVFLRTTLMGCLPLSFIYAFAGRQLGTIQSMCDIFSLEIILALLLLMVMALMPIIIKKVKGRSIDM